MNTKTTLQHVKEFAIVALVGWSFFAAIMIWLFATQAHSGYEYQSYFSEKKEIRTSCEDNVISQDVPDGTVDNTELIKDLKQQLAVAQANHWMTIRKTIEVSSQKCTERVVEKPYCGNGKLDQSRENCDWGIECTASCTCATGYIRQGNGICIAEPRNEEKQPELMKTGASVKKKLRK